MELEELQKAWSELNQRVEESESAHQQEIYNILSRQKKSWVQKRIWAEKLCMLILSGILLSILVKIFYHHSSFLDLQWPFLTAISLVVFVIISSFYSLHLLRKFQTETNMERLMRYALVYKRKYCFMYIICYLTTIPLIIWVLHQLSFYHGLLLLCVIAVCIVLDIFMFHWQIGGFKEFFRINKELSGIKKTTLSASK